MRGARVGAQAAWAVAWRSEQVADVATLGAAGDRVECVGCAGEVMMRRAKEGETAAEQRNPTRSIHPGA